jgi:hypothetical protein
MDYLHNAAQCIKLRTNQFMGNSQSAVMSTVRRGRAELKRLAYLSLPVRFTSIKTIDP